ncbi:hypothetical protein [Paenibacillus rhizoplanae]|uniref:KTSC domain-containing protein n=1 Tax=Paenibacillus rhizoplanae TaxID=1917181 RepID=A0ABW5FDB4_9BACL
MKNRKKIIFILIIIIIPIIYYFFVFTSTASFGRIEKKVSMDNHFYIEVKFEDGSLRDINVPEIVWPFLKEKRTYFMDYRYNFLRKYYLVKIKEEKI